MDIDGVVDNYDGVGAGASALLRGDLPEEDVLTPLDIAYSGVWESVGRAGNPDIVTVSILLVDRVSVAVEDRRAVGFGLVVVVTELAVALDDGPSARLVFGIDILADTEPHLVADYISSRKQ